jgi:hypothetical protein
MQAPSVLLEIASIVEPHFPPSPTLVQQGGFAGEEMSARTSEPKGLS